MVWDDIFVFIELSRRYTAPPRVVIGITKLGLPNLSDIRAAVYPSSINTYDFTLNVCGDYYSAGFNFLEIGAGNCDFQIGKWNTLENCPWTTGEQFYSHDVTFERSFPTAPQIAVWLTAFDMDSKNGMHLSATASQITSTGFRICIDSPGDCALRAAIATWIAYPTGMAGIASGRISTNDMRPEMSSQSYNSGYLAFPNGCFESPPQIFLAINALHISPHSLVNVKATTSSLSAAGFSWHLDSWGDTTLNSAEAVYIAIAQEWSVLYLFLKA